MVRYLYGIWFGGCEFEENFPSVRGKVQPRDSVFAIGKTSARKRQA